VTSSVQRARTAFARQAWGDAFSAFVASAERASLDAADSERLAICAYLIGEDDVSAEAWEAAHRAALEAGDPAESARYAFWLAFGLMLRGHVAQAGGSPAPSASSRKRRWNLRPRGISSYPSS
jgi:hypothetical protein